MQTRLIFKVFMLLLYFIVISCKSSKLTFNNNLYNMSFNDIQNHYDFEWKHGILYSADSQIYYPLYYTVSLPDDLKQVYYDSNYNIFKYPNNQYILIEESRIKSKTISDTPKFESVDVKTIKEIRDSIREFYQIRILQKSKINKDRISKVYSNGITKILFYNIKDENIETFTDIVETFKYKS